MKIIVQLKGRERIGANSGREGEDKNYISHSITEKNACGIMALNILIMMGLTMQVKVAMKMFFTK